MEGAAPKSFAVVPVARGRKLEVSHRRPGRKHQDVCASREIVDGKCLDQLSANQKHFGFFFNEFTRDMSYDCDGGNTTDSGGGARGCCLVPGNQFFFGII